MIPFRFIYSLTVPRETVKAAMPTAFRCRITEKTALGVMSWYPAAIRSQTQWENTVIRFLCLIMFVYDCLCSYNSIKVVCCQSFSVLFQKFLGDFAKNHNKAKT